MKFDMKNVHHQRIFNSISKVVKAYLNHLAGEVYRITKNCLCSWTFHFKITEGVYLTYLLYFTNPSRHMRTCILRRFAMVQYLLVCCIYVLSAQSVFSKSGLRGRYVFLRLLRGSHSQVFHHFVGVITQRCALRGMCCVLSLNIVT